MQSIEVRDRQTVLDVAMQHTGGVSTVIDLCLKNDVSVTETLTAGQPIMLSGLKNKAVVQYFKNEKVNPSSFANTDGEGIGYWRIGLDFIIS